MAKIPGMFNGGIPSNLNPDDNPTKNACNSSIDAGHADSCDGNCEQVPLSQLEIEYINEHRNWARAGMNTGMVSFDMFKLGNQIQALINVVGNILGDKEVLNDEFRRVTINAMQKLRMENEALIRRTRMGLPPNPLLGPNGKPL